MNPAWKAARNDAMEPTPATPGHAPTKKHRSRGLSRTHTAVCVYIVAMPLTLVGFSLDTDVETREAGEGWLDLVGRQQTVGNRDW